MFYLCLYFNKIFNISVYPRSVTKHCMAWVKKYLIRFWNIKEEISTVLRILTLSLGPSFQTEVKNDLVSSPRNYELGTQTEVTQINIYNKEILGTLVIHSVLLQVEMSSNKQN